MTKLLIKFTINNICFQTFKGIWYHQQNHQLPNLGPNQQFGFGCFSSGSIGRKGNSIVFGEAFRHIGHLGFWSYDVFVAFCIRNFNQKETINAPG